MKHPEAVVLDNFCPELHKGTSWKNGQHRKQKFCIFLPPVQFIKSAQIAKCLQTELSMHLYPTLPKQKSTILYIELRNSIPCSEKYV